MATEAQDIRVERLEGEIATVFDRLRAVDRLEGRFEEFQFESRNNWAWIREDFVQLKRAVDGQITSRQSDEKRARSDKRRMRGTYKVGVLGGVITVVGGIIVALIQSGSL